MEDKAIISLYIDRSEQAISETDETPHLTSMKKRKLPEDSAASLIFLSTNSLTASKTMKTLNHVQKEKKQ